MSNATESTFTKRSTHCAPVPKPSLNHGRRVKFTFNPISIHDTENINHTSIQNKSMCYKNKTQFDETEVACVGRELILSLVEAAWHK